MLCTPSSIRVWHTARQLTNSIASGAPRRRFSTESATRIRRALVIGPCRPMPEAREQARPEQSDSDDLDAPWPGCGPCCGLSRAGFDGVFVLAASFGLPVDAGGKVQRGLLRVGIPIGERIYPLVSC